MATDNDNISRLRMDDRLGDEAWVEIKIDSPDQLVSTWIYKPLGQGRMISTDIFTDVMRHTIEDISKRIDNLPESESNIKLRLEDEERSRNDEKNERNQDDNSESATDEE